MQTMMLEQYYASRIHIEINDLLNSSFNPFSTNVPGVIEVQHWLQMNLKKHQ